MMRERVACVFGASGFVGRHVVQRLAAAGWRVRAAVRDPESAAFLRPMGDPGQVVPFRGDLNDPASVRAAVAGADVVVNLVGILYERGRQTFQNIHVAGAAAVAKAAAEAGAKTLVHVSALGASASSPSRYARSKAAGEEAVRAAFPAAVILRPSVIFGAEDDFFNRFARLASFSPVLPVIGRRGGTLMQPVFVGDVADAVLAAVRSPTAAGHTYSLGGPATYRFADILRLVLAATGFRDLLVPLPLSLARTQAFFLALLPKPPLTPDQVTLLATDNVVPAGAPGLADLGIAATAVEAVVPGYLKRYASRRAAGAQAA